MQYFLGIDTSCYTTSIAVVTEEGKLIANSRKILTVKQGNRGLRQSEALFQHVNNLPVLIGEIIQRVDFTNIKRVSVSDKPRTAPNSYMPVFNGGTSFASVIADTLKVPLKKYSHQDGHIMAGLWSAGREQLMDMDFLCFHISGGTTELLHVKPLEQGFGVHIVGGSKDLHAGQFVDRIGVALGLPFPCGPHLEQLALQTTKALQIPVSTNKTWINFSGPETHVQRTIINIDEEKRASVALGVLNCISVSVQKVIESAIIQTGIRHVLMVGGVCSNSIIRKSLVQHFQGRGNIYFAKPQFSTDNAVGIALLGGWRSEK